MPLGQHAPSRALQGLTAAQTELFPRNVLLPVQLLAMVTEHMPAFEQHAPVTHGVGTQSVPTPLKVCPAGQPAAVRTTQAPLVWQHAPVKLAHGFGEHVVPLPMYTSPVVPPQAVPPVPEASLTVQVPSPAQHAPVGMVQGLGVQALPTVPKVLGSEQPLGSVSVHTPRGLQHGPSSLMHGLTVQVVPKPRKVLVPVQPAAMWWCRCRRWSSTRRGTDCRWS